MEDALVAAMPVRKHHSVELQSDWAAEFVEAHRERVFLTALRIVGRREAAEDVAQDALVKAWRARNRLRSSKSETAWVRRIVVRCSVTYLREHREQQMDESCASASGEAPGIQRLAVQEVLDRMPIRSRVILALALGEGLSYREISEAMRIPMGTVASRLSAAKARFRKLWGNEG